MADKTVKAVIFSLLLCLVAIRVHAQSPLPGDANKDNRVDGQDYVIWLSHYGTATTRGATDGDFNADGTVAGQDYVIWLNNYGKSVLPSATPASPSPTAAGPTPTGGTANTTVANWKNNATGAFVLEFDDSWPSHIDIAVPELTKRNLVGTFFINPGNYGFQARKSGWQQVGPAGVQELANHTMTHSGATDYADADYEIGECARTIWSLRPAGASKLMGFEKGGGTTWSITSAQMAEIQAKYNAVTLTNVSYPSQDRTAGNRQNVLNLVNNAISGKGWSGTNFHCIAGSGDNCAYTTNNADFLAILDYVQSKVQTNEIWNGGWAAIHMYDRERSSATVRAVSSTDARIEISLTSAMDPTLYLQPLTLMTTVSGSWSAVRVTQDTVVKSYTARNGTLTYDAVPGKGNVILERQ